MTHTNIILLGAFIGFFLESLLLSYRFFDIKKLILTIAIALLLFLISPTDQRSSIPWNNLPLALIGYALGFAIVYRKELLPVISEYSVFAQTLFFWLGWYYFTYDFVWKTAIAGLGLVPTLLVVFTLIRKKPLSKNENIVLYGWFMLAGLSLILFQIPLWTQSMHLSSMAFYEAVIAGMLVFYVALQSVYVLMFVPPPAHRPSLRRQWKQHIETASLKFLTIQSKALHIIIIFVVFFLLTFLNEQFHLLARHVFFNLMIIGSLPILSYQKISSTN
ncbi:hypothetical protein H6758_05160 [Candidatus Nomurabacteria bacterium]|nr:hypothetical protein [Candidatus Nomurabacteria bacterium]